MTQDHSCRKHILGLLIELLKVASSGFLPGRNRVRGGVEKQLASRCLLSLFIAASIVQI